MATRSLATASYTPPKSNKRQTQAGSTVAGRPRAFGPRIGFDVAEVGGGAGVVPRQKTAGITGTANQQRAAQFAPAAAKADQVFAPAAATGPAAGAAGLTQGAMPWYNDAPQGGFAQPGDPWTGFAQRYAPGYADILLSNPSQIMYDQAVAMGLQQPGGEMGATQALAPYADILPFLYAITNSQGANAGSREAQVNFAAQFAKNMLTPGGQDVSLPGIMSAVYGNPSVQELFRTGNPAQNVNALNDIVGMTAGLSFNPYLQRMVQAATDRAAYEYLSQYTQGQNPGNYDQWLTQNTNPLGGFFGIR